MNNILNVVMTPVRNEAWVLRAFLTATSQWADYIIIGEQMSTDGSRDIYNDFPKVIVIDNNNPEFNEAERQAMLVAKAREVAAGRDTLLWGLDADEIITANAFETEDWNKIINSKPGAVFYFQWAIVSEDLQNYQLSSMKYPWLFHDDGIEPHGNYVRKMHSMRIPYPIDEHDINYVTDFYVLHLAWINPYRVSAKRRFYTFIDWNINHGSVIRLARDYTAVPDSTPLNLLNSNMIYTKEHDGFDLWSLVKCDEKHCWMDDYVFEHLGQYNTIDTSRLMIWDDEFLDEYKLHDTRNFLIKFLHFYLQSTMKFKNFVVIRAIDKLLKRII